MKSVTMECEFLSVTVIVTATIDYRIRSRTGPKWSWRLISTSTESSRYPFNQCFICLFLRKTPQHLIDRIAWPSSKNAIFAIKLFQASSIFQPVQSWDRHLAFNLAQVYSDFDSIAIEPVQEQKKRRQNECEKVDFGRLELISKSGDIQHIKKSSCSQVVFQIEFFPNFCKILRCLGCKTVMLSML